jgi:hypothetical protein
MKTRGPCHEEDKKKTHRNVDGACPSKFALLLVPLVREYMTDIHDLCETVRDRYRFETLDLRQGEGFKGFRRARKADAVPVSRS